MKHELFHNIKIFIKKLYRMPKVLMRKIVDILPYYESENKLARDAHEYWNQNYSKVPQIAQDAHWKDKGIFEDGQRWLLLGKEHLDLILSHSELLNFRLPVKHIVEWGCGGGANAIHFAPFTEKFIGIDISQESLDECYNQLLENGHDNFHPILINASTPKSILSEPVNEVDLFICTYVYELLPSPAYGLTVLKLANNMLRNKGVAFIQIRYNDGRKELKSKKWGYKITPYNMTTYTIEEFWENSKELGFEPVSVFLKPNQPLVNDQCYAYFFLKKVNCVN